VADVTDPVHPVEAGGLDTPGYAYGVAVSGTLAYVADAWEGLRVVNVSNPAKPVEVGACDTPGWALSVAVAGTTAYVADGAFGLRVIKVSDPHSPHEVGTYEADSLARRVAFSGDIAYVADQRGGLRAIDVNNPAHPTQVGLYSPMAQARRVAVAGSYAYVATEFLGLRVIDVSDPAHPREVGAYDTEGAYTADVVVSGTYAYLATFMYGPYNLHVLDVSDPAHPTRVSTISSNQEYKDLALVDDILYVAYGWGLQLIDVSNPTAPAKLGSFEPLQDTQNVTVSGTLAYVADDGYGVKIVDVSNPYSPTLVSTYDYQWANDVAVAGDKLYMAGHGFGLRVLDISDLENPFGIGFYDTPGIADGVTISGTEAYISDEGGGLVVVDVSNPFTPTLLTAYDTAGGAWHTTLVGNYAYVADRHGGLVILERTAGASASGFEELPLSTPSSLTALEAITERQGPRRHAGTVADPVNFRVSTADAARVWDSGVPALASACVVTSTADSGAGTLRNCLENATSGTTVTFDPLVFPPTNPVTIALSSELPPITQGYLTIDGSNAGVILDGSSTPPGTNGLLLMSDGNTVKGLQILYFPAIGITIGNASYNRIGGDRTKGNGPLGESNLVSGNGVSGVVIGGRDAETIGNIISGNLIGTDLSGKAVISNRRGVALQGCASYNMIGGTTASERNIISGNDIGVEINQKCVNGNVIAGNYIGTDISGMRPLGNREYGVVIWDGPDGNIVGGAGPGEGNLISGNPNGAMIAGIDTNHNAVIGNWIGTDATGTQALGNGSGILLYGPGYNRVERNVISGNAGTAIVVGDGQALILGNFIGTDTSGTQPLGNGVGIGLSGRHTFVGGTTALERNAIADNHVGIDVNTAGTEYNWIAGNAIGTNTTGTLALGNGEMGVRMRDYAAHTFIQGNTIAFNRGEWGKVGNVGGVYVEHSLYNAIRRNSIHNNIGVGIVLGEGGNSLLPAPVLTHVTTTTVSGTAGPGCTVEVFSDAEDEGRVYEGSTVADASGVFTFNKAGRLTGPYVTATATDPAGNTSAFSLPRPIGHWLYLPVVLKGY